MARSEVSPLSSSTESRAASISLTWNSSRSARRARSIAPSTISSIRRRIAIEGAYVVRELAALIVQTGKAVKQMEVLGRPKQREMVALAVNIDQQRADSGKSGSRRRATVDARDTPAGRVDLAAEQNLVGVGFDADLVEQTEDRVSLFDVSNIEGRLRSAPALAPVRTTSAPIRSPSTAPSASMMIDLPAPVAPVSAFIPG